MCVRPLRVHCFVSDWLLTVVVAVILYFKRGEVDNAPADVPTLPPAYPTANPAYPASTSFGDQDGGYSGETYSETSLDQGGQASGMYSKDNTVV